MLHPGGTDRADQIVSKSSAEVDAVETEAHGFVEGIAGDIRGGAICTNLFFGPRLDIKSRSKVVIGGLDC